jgi:uncharacterized membrane protein YphA (DoxX/SURF4 family)
MLCFKEKIMHGDGAVFLPMIGRVLLGFFFVFLAVSHAMNWRIRVDGLRQRNVIMPTLVLWVGIVLYFLGGLCLVFNLFICTFVMILSIMLLIRAVLLGNFWSKTGDEQHLASIDFMTNIALVGALLMAL